MQKFLSFFVFGALLCGAGCTYSPSRCTGSVVKSCKPYILFDYESSKLSPDEIPYLDWACQKAKSQNWRDIVIDAHTYIYGNDGNTFDLGQRRANVVRDYLIACGVEPSRIQVHILGNTQLKTKARDEQYNDRRVVIRYTGNYGESSQNK